MNDSSNVGHNLVSLHGIGFCAGLVQVKYLYVCIICERSTSSVCITITIARYSELINIHLAGYACMQTC